MNHTILSQQRQSVGSLLSDDDCMPPMPSFGEGRMLFQFQPSDNDVIYSQHKDYQNHAGNLALQAIIDENIDDYVIKNCQLAKATIVSNIVETIQERSPYGGFVEQIGGQWFEIGAWNARERVLKALEETIASNESEETTNDTTVRLDILVSVCQLVSTTKKTQKKRSISGTFEKRVSDSLHLDVSMSHLDLEVLNDLNREVSTKPGRSSKAILLSPRPTARRLTTACYSPNLSASGNALVLPEVH